MTLFTHADCAALRSVRGVDPSAGHEALADVLGGASPARGSDRPPDDQADCKSSEAGAAMARTSLSLRGGSERESAGSGGGESESLEAVHGGIPLVGRGSVAPMSNP